MFLENLDYLLKSFKYPMYQVYVLVDVRMYTRYFLTLDFNFFHIVDKRIFKLFYTRSRHTSFDIL